MGYWYPQIAVYDDVDGWVADPYLLAAEFYMDPADYDVRVTVPRGWVVGATGTLRMPRTLLTPAARDSLAAARGSGRVVRVVTPDSSAAARVCRGTSAGDVALHRDRCARLCLGTSDRYAWDATRALVGADTVDIHSFFRRSAPAVAWARGGARYTRDAVQQLSLDLWPVSLSADDLDGGRDRRGRDGVPDADVRCSPGPTPSRSPAT